MLITVQGTTPKYSSIEVQHCTALMASSFAFIQLSITAPSLAIFIKRGCGNAVGGDVALDRVELRLRGVVAVLHALDAAEDFGEIDGLDGDAVGFENFFAVANGVERRGARADGADAQTCAGRWRRGRPRRTTRGPCRTSRNRALRCAAWSASTECRTAAGCCRPTSCRRSCRGGRRWSSCRGCRGRPGPAPGTLQVRPGAAPRRWLSRRRNSAA